MIISTMVEIIMKLSISLLVSVGASAMANPAGVGGIGGALGGGLVGGHGGGHVVAPVHHGGDYHEQPDPFKFEYGVHDDKYYTDFSEHRAGDEYGNIVGEYQVARPDGRIQYVKYTADSTTIVTISSILDILNSTIRKSYLILSNNIPVLVTSPVLTEVCVILVIMHSIFELEWIWLFMIISTMASSMSSHNSTTMSSNKSPNISSSNSPNTSRACHSRSSYRHQKRNRKLHGCCIY